jgi:Peptidase M15
MQAPRRKVANVSALLALCLVSARPSPACAGLLDEPPRAYSFKLDEPSAADLPLLASFREEHPGRTRRYLVGAFARWRTEPWWSLTWHQGSCVPPSSAPSGGGASRATGEEGSLDRRFAREIALAPGSLFERDGRDPRDGHAGRDLRDADTRLFGFEPREIERYASGLRLPVASDAWLGRLDPSWSAPVFASTGATFASDGFGALWSLPPKKPAFDWRCRRRPVRFFRSDGENDAFALIKCDGSVAPQALDRLSLIARATFAERPGELLPDEPAPEATARGEWTNGVRLAHLGLLWVLQRIADAFPWRAVVVYSGYRPGAAVAGKSPSHHSMHSEARAVDISVVGIPNAALFTFCRTLKDVGCGFYPNSKFVHVDARADGAGRAFWIDASGPGEPSRYVDAWPGVVEGGALTGDGNERGAREKAGR